MATRCNLYHGEQSSVVAGHPVVYKFIPGRDLSQPLVVFVPGMAHNGRISYGHPGSHSKDFLAHWFNHYGYSFLAISYPLDAELPVMPATSPHFTIPEWGTQTAVVISQVVKENSIGGKIIILGWSMAGKLLRPVTEELRNLELDANLFVSLAATPALPGLLPSVARHQLDQTVSGYSKRPYANAIFRRHLDEQEKINGLNGSRFIIDPTIYERDYLGATPVGLTACGYEFDMNSGTFVEERNPWQLLEDSQAHVFWSLPSMAAIVPTSGLDFRHGITDKATWSYLIIQHTMAELSRNTRVRRYLQAAEESSEASLAVDRSRFQDLQKVVSDISELLTTEIMGNHFFFVGEFGAKKTVDTVIEFQQKLDSVKQSLANTLDSLLGASR
ncbi:hypothetical protein PENANT_c019G02591 [Penicillium antarcticum]|uniref:AB hydrolase-1 domain-containing protein n=1 Tax=Penicillium antarcticum TaxID=416450 RepID=A0A1V6Q0P6_9EURO|nr:uncharacterized protein N7508_001089 [Penicillium antarcticum]KAJ5316581.1 hypothetical protein N7508_001089 [Penicillium antarcticum]OQD82848.1 hypothetical protein PENANT_c019G02591 [Penicillium antarcticum]